jgi:hypothetical protein
MCQQCFLRRTPEQTGFSTLALVGTERGSIPGGSNYRLDTESDENLYTPDSLYLEAIRT